ncbi:MAG: type II secretion system major pseudopilin GspG [Candidatus Omnitrophota bacterium]
MNKKLSIEEGFTSLENKRLPKGRLSLTGFTLIEIMLVIVIISCLVAMVMPRLTGRLEQAKISTAKMDITVNIPTALKLYILDNGDFPTTEQGLKALVTKSTTTPIPENWNGPYLEKHFLDPWKSEYKYKCPGAHRTYDYDLYSLGKDGVESDDDVVNWE